MLRLWKQLLSTGVIAASLLALLACLGQDFLSTAFLCRVPLAAACLVGLLALAPYWPLPAMFGGLVRLSLPRMVLASVATTLATMSLVKTTATALQYGVERYALADLAAGLTSPQLNGWFWSPGLNLWQSLPALALLTSLVLHPPDRGRRRLGQILLRAATACCAVALTVGFVEILTPQLAPGLRPLTEFSWWIPSAIRTLIGPGYFDPQDGSILAGHVQSAAFLAVALVVYAAGYVLLHPLRRGRFWEQLQFAVPPIFYLLLLVTICVWLLTGVTFFFDHWRIPTLMAVGLFSYLAYRWFLFDHYFTSVPMSSDMGPTELTPLPANATPSTADGAQTLPVPDQFHFVMQTPPTPSWDDASRAADGLRDDFPRQSHLPERRLSSLGPDDCLVVVAACGGGILAGAWFVLALTRLFQRFPRLESSTGLISAVSGGSLGTLYLIDQMLGQKDACPEKASCSNGEHWSRANRAVRRSALEAISWGIAYPGFLRGLLPALVWDRRYDHGWAAECGWQAPLVRPDLTLGQVAQAYREGRCPQVILNAVCLENGRRFLFSSGVDQLDSAAAQRLARVDFFSEYRGRDIPLVTAARMSATFPYVSPIARIDIEPDRPAYHLADGGYFDNSGVVSALEWIRWQLEKPASILKARGLRRILVLRMSTPALQANSASMRVGWRNALVGPMLTLMSVRGTSQAERAEQELHLFASWCREVHDVEFEHVEIAYSGAGPFSWQLSSADEAELETCWLRDYQQPLERLVRGQPLDLQLASHQAIQKLATLLMPNR